LRSGDQGTVLNDIVLNIGSLSRQAWNVRWTDPDQSRHLTAEVQSILSSSNTGLAESERALHTASIRRTDAWLNRGQNVNQTIEECSAALALFRHIDAPMEQVDLLCVLALAQYRAGRHNDMLNSIRTALGLYSFRQDSYASLHLMAAGISPRFIKLVRKESAASGAVKIADQWSFDAQTATDTTILDGLVSLARDRQDTYAEISVLVQMGFAHLSMRAGKDARLCVEIGLALARQHHSRQLESLCRYCIAVIDLNSSQYQSAEELAQSVRSAARLDRDELLAVRCDELIGRAHFDSRRWDSALTMFVIALERAQQLNYVRIEGRCSEALADLFEAQSDYKMALFYHRKFYAISRKLSLPDGQTYAPAGSNEDTEPEAKSVCEISPAVAVEKTEFMEGFNHEVRSLLTIIFGEAQLLKRDAVDGRSILSGSQVAQIEQLIENTRYLHSFISELMDLSKVDSSERQNLVLDRVDIRALIERVVSRCQDRVVQHGIRIKGHVVPEVTELVAVNAAKVQRILEILVRSMIRLIDGGTISVVVNTDSGWLQCELVCSESEFNRTQVDQITGLLSGNGVPTSSDGLPSETCLELKLSQQLAATIGGVVCLRNKHLPTGVPASGFAGRLVLRLPLRDELESGLLGVAARNTSVSPDSRTL